MKNESPEDGEHDSGFLEIEVRQAIQTLSTFLRGSAKEEKNVKKIAQTFSCYHLTVNNINNQQIARVMQMILESVLRILSNEHKLSADNRETLAATATSSSSLSSSSSPTSNRWTVNYIISLANFILDNMDNLLRDGNGVHLMVTTVEVIGGVRVGRQWSRKTMGFAMRSSISEELEKDNLIDKIDTDFENILKKFAKQLIINRSDRYLREIILDRGTSLIQNLLFILKVRLPDTCQSVVKRLVDVIFATPSNRIAITTNSVSAYLVEAIMLVTSQSRLNYIWDKHLKGNLMEMWKHDIANFVVQRLIDAVQDINLFTAICDEMLPKLATVFAYNRPGIGVCLAKAAEKFTEMQPAFIEALMKAFNCHKPKERQIYLVRLMLFGDNLTSQNKKLRNSQAIWLHGSLMLQYMFRFHQPYKLSKCLLALDSRKLVAICNDKSGSHVIDCFLRSPSVVEKHKSAFKEKLRGHYAYVASDRFGSRVIDSLLAYSNLETRNLILDELTSPNFHYDNNSTNLSRSSRFSSSPPTRSPPPATASKIAASIRKRSSSQIFYSKYRCADICRSINDLPYNNHKRSPDDSYRHHHNDDYSSSSKRRRN